MAGIKVGDERVVMIDEFEEAAPRGSVWGMKFSHYAKGVAPDVDEDNSRIIRVNSRDRTPEPGLHVIRLTYYRRMKSVRVWELVT